jgi:predicted nucleotide-binding protein/ElaB/YqjD/DUF883 family membrane-anchored ribosome-binding protein
MARAFTGDYLVTDFYENALRQIANVLSHGLNYPPFVGVEDDQLVDHFLRQAIGSDREGGFELWPLQELNPPRSRSIDYASSIVVGSPSSTFTPLLEVRLPLVRHRSNQDAVLIRPEQNWPDETNLKTAVSFRWQDDSIYIHGKKDEIISLVALVEELMESINADIARYTPEFRSRVQTLVKERRHHLAQAEEDLGQVRQALGITASDHKPTLDPPESDMTQETDYEPISRLPRIFIGSSTEGLAIAEAIQANLDPSRAAECIVWTQGVFRLGGSTLESLVHEAGHCDYAVLVVTPDDMVERRGETHFSPRDNVVFELGLFMGALGQERTFMVVPNGISLELPSDLNGITQGRFNNKRSDNNLLAALGPFCSHVKARLQTHGLRPGFAP